MSRPPDSRCVDCGAEMMPAMVRCRQCGRRSDSSADMDSMLISEPAEDGSYRVEPACAPGPAQADTLHPNSGPDTEDDSHFELHPKFAREAAPDPASSVTNPAHARRSPTGVTPRSSSPTKPVRESPPARKSARYTITVECPACRYPVTARGRMRGQRVKCPECRGPVLIEPTGSMTSAERAADVADVRVAPVAASRPLPPNFAHRPGNAGVAALPHPGSPPGVAPPPSWVAEKAMLQRKLQAMENAEKQIAVQRPGRRWTWRDLIPDFIYGLASDRTLAIVACSVLMVGGLALVLWWGPFGTGESMAAAPAGPVSVARGFVSSLSYSADGKQIAAGRTQGRVEVWDLAARELQQSGASVRGRYVAMNADGTRLVAGDEKISGLYELPSGNSIAQESGIRCVVTNPGSTHAVSLAVDKRIIVWNLAAGRIETQLQPVGDEAMVVAIGPSGQFCAWGTRTGKILVVDVSSAAVSKELIIHQGGPITALAIDDSGERIAAVTADSRLHVLSGQNYDPQWHHSRPSGLDFVSRLVWLDGERILAAGGTRMSICSTQHEPLAWSVELQTIDALATSPDGRSVAIGSRDESAIILLDPSNGENRATLDLASE